MSLLHRGIFAAAASAALKNLEPLLVDALEGAVAIVAPPAAPIVNAVVGAADALIRSNNPDIPAAPGAVTADHVAAAVATVSGAAPVPAPAPAPAQAPAQVTVPAVAAPEPTPAVHAALAAVNALALQLSSLATQLEALRSQLDPANLTAKA